MNDDTYYSIHFLRKQRPQMAELIDGMNFKVLEPYVTDGVYSAAIIDRRPTDEEFSILKLAMEHFEYWKVTHYVE